MQRPGKPITRKTIMMTNRMRELELKEKSSKSLLANVLDMDDDFRWVTKELIWNNVLLGSAKPTTHMFQLITPKLIFDMEIWSDFEHN